MTHYGHLMPTRYPYNVVLVGRTILSWVLPATAGIELRDSLDTNFHGLRLLSDDALRHALPGFFKLPTIQKAIKCPLVTQNSVSLQVYNVSCHSTLVDDTNTQHKNNSLFFMNTVNLQNPPQQIY